MKRLRPMYWALLAAAAGGCATVPDIHLRVEQDVRAAVHAEAGRGEAGQQTGRSGQVPTIEDVLAEVVGNDHHYRLALADVRLAGVQLTDAQRQPWPRLFAEGLVEMPINHGSMDTFFSGGLYLRFDLVRALLYRNAVTIAQVSQAAGREKCRAAAAQAALDFLGKLVRLKAALQAEARNAAGDQLAAQAAAEAEALFKSGRLPSERWYVWELRRAQKDIEKQQLAARVQKARFDVLRAYRGTAEGEILRLAASFMERLAEAKASSASPADILEKTPTVTKAKLDLFLAEVAVLEARLKRLPVVSLALAGGNIPLQGHQWQEDGAIVPMVGISLPLIDLGDIARGVKKAEIRSAQVREQMIQAVETAHLDLEAAHWSFVLAKTSVQAAQQLLDATAKRQHETRALLKTGAVSVMDLHEVAWMQADAECALDHAREEDQLALLAERAARGELLEERMESTLFAKLQSGPPCTDHD